MRAIAVGTILLVALASTAQAGPREQCASSTGATSGAAFNACISAKKAEQAQKPLYKDAGSRARCRMGNC